MRLHPDERKDWGVAFAASFALHALILFFLLSVTLAQPAPEPKLTLVLRTAPGKTGAATAQPAAQPAPARSDPVAKPAPRPQPVPKPIPKPLPKPTPKPVEKTVETPKTEAPAAETTPVAPDAGGTAAQTEPAGGGTGSAGSGPGAGKSGAGTGAPVDVATLEITKKVIPEYPSFSRKRKEEGTVRILITIAGGAVTEARIDSSSGSERLDNSALRAVKQWRFNQREEIRAIVPVVFRLEN